MTRHSLRNSVLTVKLNSRLRWGAYQKGGRVTAEINAILAEAFCQALLVPVVGMYEDEKTRILE